LIKGGRVAYSFRVCGIDSSDVAVVSCPRTLATIEVGRQKLCIYAERDADCGKRRKKRDKSDTPPSASKFSTQNDAGHLSAG
jgi:hypothetical protein